MVADVATVLKGFNPPDQLLAGALGVCVDRELSELSCFEEH
jgi:hypothetical protein